MNVVLLVRIENVFGRILYYPANDQAERLAAFGGGATFTEPQLHALYAMGFRIEESKAPGPTLPDFAALDTYREPQEKSPKG